MMFPSALAVGIEGLSEVLEIELPEGHEPQLLAELFRRHAPPGLAIQIVEPLAGGKTHLRGMTYEVDVPVERRGLVAERMEWLRRQSSYLVTREGRDSPLELRPLIEELSLDDGGTLAMRLRVERDGSARPREVLEALGLANVESLGIVLRRTAVELSST
jgi:hypothetical protein